MIFKKNFVPILILAIIFFGFLFYFVINQSPQQEESSYETLKKSHPSFEADVNRLTVSDDFQALGLYAENLLTEAKPGYEKAYLTYVAAYSYTNAVTRNNDDNDSLKKALSFSKELIFDEDQYPIFRAYALDSYDRLLFSFMKKAIRDQAMADPSFQKYTDSTDPKNTRLFRKNLLTHATSLYPAANAYFKLALLSAQDIQGSSSADTPTQKAANEQSKNNFLNYMTQGDISLKRDYSNQGLFGNTSHVPESLLSRTLAAQEYYEITNENPYGDINDLYAKAVVESEKLNPSYTTAILFWKKEFEKKKNR